ncbi:MAG: hypothetical protein OEY44_01590 [Candidatus Peregrinibacteria bacterium]|nr:hypothetical protein [Candidatus Peregrinibacteria bacterium]
MNEIQPEPSIQELAATAMQNVEENFQLDFEKGKSSKQISKGAEVAKTEIEELVLDTQMNPYDEQAPVDPKITALAKKTKENIDNARDIFILTNYSNLQKGLDLVVKSFKDSSEKQYSTTVLLRAHEKMRNEGLPQLNAMDPQHSPIALAKTKIAQELESQLDTIEQEIGKRLNTSLPANPEIAPLRISKNYMKEYLILPMHTLDTSRAQRPRQEIQLGDTTVVLIKHSKGFSVESVADASGRRHLFEKNRPTAINIDDVAKMVLDQANVGREALAQKRYKEEMRDLRVAAKAYDRKQSTEAIA